MKITKLRIKNLFGISERELDGSSVEITGTNGTGKTSIIDAIRYALTNDSARDLVIKNGENEGEILIETDTGLSINRKKRASQTDYKSIKENGTDVPSPESFIKQLFSPLQLDPVSFTSMSRKEQNRAILDLIDFKWDLNWIKKQFGEIPSWVNYDQNILQVLHDIQKEDGDYFKKRQDINRDIRNQKAFIEEIAKDIPSKFDRSKWETYNVGESYTKIQQIKTHNSQVERAKIFRDSYENKKRGLEADREIKINTYEKELAAERERLTSDIERLKAEIIANQDKLGTLNERLEDKKRVAESEFNEALAKLDKDNQVAIEFSEKQIIDCADLEEEVKLAEEMKKHLNEYDRMKSLEKQVDSLVEESQELTNKIELARSLPGDILATATIPINGFTVENGIPLINGLPISNLSEGEQLELCVDVTLSKPNNMQIILIDGVERLSEDNRSRLYNKCKEKGLQFIATRTTNGKELEVNYL